MNFIGILHRQQKHIQEGINLYRFAEELETIMRIILKALIH